MVSLFLIYLKKSLARAHQYLTAFRILEVGHTAGVSYEVYHSSITLYGKPNELVTFKALGAVIAISGAITLLVQVRQTSVKPCSLG